MEYQIKVFTHSLIIFVKGMIYQYPRPQLSNKHFQKLVGILQ